MPQKKSATGKSGSRGKKLSVGKRPIKDLQPSEKDAKKVKGGVDSVSPSRFKSI